MPGARAITRRPSGRGSWPSDGCAATRRRIGFLVLFIVLVVMCLLAPVYSNDIAHIGPNANNITGTVNVGGKQQNIVSLDGVPIGPTFTQPLLLRGRRPTGRDLAVRLLYGGRTSLVIGGIATVIIIVFGTI